MENTKETRNLGFKLAIIMGLPIATAALLFAGCKDAIQAQLEEEAGTLPRLVINLDKEYTFEVDYDGEKIEGTHIVYTKRSIKSAIENQYAETENKAAFNSVLNRPGFKIIIDNIFPGRAKIDGGNLYVSMYWVYANSNEDMQTKFETMFVEAYQKQMGNVKSAKKSKPAFLDGGARNRARHGYIAMNRVGRIRNNRTVSARVRSM